MSGPRLGALSNIRWSGGTLKNTYKYTDECAGHQEHHLGMEPIYDAESI
jgi:hypothetical protein